jgi:uncharacterized protein
MELTREHPGKKIYVRAVGPGGITIAEDTYAGSVILSPETVDPDWPVESVADVSEETLQPIFDLSPEVVILGTGQTQRFLEPALMMNFHRQAIGIEIMNTQAACRTFNVLVMENRKVVAALLPPGAD